MNKKFIAIICCVVLILVIALVFTFNNRLSKNELDDLYSKIETMILYEENNEKKKNVDTFISIKRLGYNLEKEKTFVYCWIQVENYFLNSEGIVELDSGSSMPYKFIFENGEIAEYEIPRDGSEYEKAIHELFPITVWTKFNGIYNDDKLKNDILTQVEEFYKISREQIY